MQGMSVPFLPSQAQHSVLPWLCRKPGQTEQAGLGQEKEGWYVEKVPLENPLK